MRDATSKLRRVARKIEGGQPDARVCAALVAATTELHHLAAAAALSACGPDPDVALTTLCALAVALCAHAARIERAAR